MSALRASVPLLRVIAFVVIATISLGGNVADSGFVTAVIVLTSLLGAAVIPRALFRDAASAQWLFGPALATGVISAAVSAYVLLVVAGVPVAVFGLFHLTALPVGLRRLWQHARWQHDEQASHLTLATTAIAIGLYSRPLLGCGVLGTSLLLLGRTSAQQSLPPRQHRWRTVAFVGFWLMSCIALVFRREIAIPLPDTWTLHGESMALGLSDQSGSSWLYTPTLRYHWLGNLWLGTQIRLFDLEPLVGSVILIPVLALLAISSMMFAVTSASGDASVPVRWALATATLCAASVVEPLTLTVDRQASNVLGTLALVLAIPILAEATAASSGDPRLKFGLLGLLGFFLSATKAPFALVLGGGLVAMSLTTAAAGFRPLVQQRTIRRLGVAVGVWGLGTVTGYLAISGGDASTGQIRILNPLTGMKIFRPPSLGSWSFDASASALGAALIFASIFFTRTPLLMFMFGRSCETRRDFAPLASFTLGALLVGTATTWTRFVGEQTLYYLGGALAASGVVAALLLNLVPSTMRSDRVCFAPGVIALAVVLTMRLSVDLARALNHLNVATTLWYATLVVLALLTLATLWALVHRSTKLPRLSLGTCAVVVASTGLALFIVPPLSSSLTALVTTRGLDDSPLRQGIIEVAVRDAANAIRAQSTDRAVIATNYVCKVQTCNLRPHLVGVISQRTLLWESAGDPRAFPHFDPDSRVADSSSRYHLNELVTTHIGTTELEQLSRAGVGWVLIAPQEEDKSRDNPCKQVSSRASCVFSRDGVTVVRLND